MFDQTDDADHQLAEVTGIGPAKLNRLRDQVTL
jgi:DNA uptake protein ComE-like DNA-binding protein